MKLGIIISSIVIIFGISAQAKKTRAGHKKCSWGCKSIPPLTKSHLQFGEGQQEALPSSNLKILIWNIYKGRKDNFSEFYPKHIEDSHLALIQEYMMSKDVIPTIDDNREHNMSVSFWMKKKQETGVITISTAKAEKIAVQRTSGKEPFVKSPKTNMVAYHKLQGSDLSLLSINIHGMNMTKTIELKKQIEMASSHINAHSGPVIFAGDFNTRNEERQIMVDQFMSGHHLEKVIYPNEFRKKKKLDHVYIRGLKINNAHLYGKNMGSDHPAIVLNVSLNKE